MELHYDAIVNKMKMEPFDNIMERYQERIDIIQKDCKYYEYTGYEGGAYITMDKVDPDKVTYLEVIQDPKTIESVNHKINELMGTLNCLFYG
jgi:hypothetical protein